MKRANKLYCALTVAGAFTFQQAINKITSEYQAYMHGNETARLNYVIGEQSGKLDELLGKTKDISTIPSDVALDARIRALIRQEVTGFNSKPGTKHDITEEEIYDIIGKESCGRVCARSNKDAIGLMQVLLSTAASEYGIKTEAELFKIENNIHIGVDYYGRMKNMFGGSITLAQAAYNAGPGAVRAYGGVPPFPETMAYVSSKPAAISSRKKTEKLSQKEKKLASNFIKADSLASKVKKDADLNSPHYVESGETLFAIGRKYDRSPKEIARHNNIPSNYKVKEGQLLKIPFKKG